MGQTKIKTLDLHGFQGDDVVDAVDQYLLKMSNSQKARIMTGKGKGIVQKLVITYLKQAGYPWEYEKLSNGKPNSGVLIVFIN